jgi:Second Messenger Oligonucleotide or Dinucleotide Synthetase domain
VLTTIQAFDKFRQRLELSDTEQQDAANRQAEVRECIRESFDIKTDSLSGSYRRHTKTKPLKDVDVMFVLGEKEKWRRDKPPIETLQAFEKCLKTKYTEHGQVEIGRRSVTVEFEKDYYTDDHEGKVLSIDVVPAFECGGGDYEIPDKITGKWIKTNPEEHREQATAKNKELDGRWVPLVKMAKVRGRLVRALPRRGRCGRREAELASPGHRVGAQSHARSRDRARPWTDAEIARAIRGGIAKGGRPFHWQAMIWDHASNWDEEDVRALIAFLRSLPPVNRAIPATRPPAADDCEVYTFWVDASSAPGCR